ncbi:hypothetical protein QR680_001846 [Steinernema hermaphroditum]|uniref:DUF19 domain-containing protein n=1 Tax=Steinernema hermaphroditum TaxID=289476 RepID=A0AA39LH10_9BILA|nr:hypothetical protein QR680_001846 [Steinernema hermaphroditum]
MTMTLLVLLALVGTTVVAGRSCTEQLHNAQNTFNDHLQIQADLDWLSIDKLRAAVEQKFSDNGAFGLREICGAFNAYRKSFDDLTKCARVVELLRDANGYATGVTRQQAFEYFSLMNQLDYTCGGGYEVFTNHDSCLAQQFTNKTTDLKACRDTFFERWNLDPVDTCGYAQDAIDCYKNVFAACGDSAGFFGCEYERVGIHVHFPQCADNFCIVNHKFE